MADDSVLPVDLTVDDRTTPLNLPPETRPDFSWSVPDAEWGREQAAYRILVARSEQALEDRDPLRNSGRVDAADATGIDYGGPPFAADTRYCWTVRVWSDRGDATAFGVRDGSGSRLARGVNRVPTRSRRHERVPKSLSEAGRGRGVGTGRPRGTQGTRSGGLPPG